MAYYDWDFLLATAKDKLPNYDFTQLTFDEHNAGCKYEYNPYATIM